MPADDSQVFEQNKAIDGALRKADAAEKFSFTAFVSTTLLSMLGIGGMTLPFFALPFLILGRLFSGIMTSLNNIHQKNLNLSNLTELAVSMILGVMPMLIITMSMTVVGVAALIAQFMTLGTIFFGISSVYHFGGIFSNFFKAFMAPSGSNERKAYLQQALKHTINCFISVTLFALIAFSFAPPVTLGLLGAVSIVSTLYITWSFFPKLRNAVKSLLGLAKTDDSFTVTHNKQPTLTFTDIKSPESEKLESAHYGHLFKRAYRREVIRHYIEKKQPQFAKDYLLKQIEQFRGKYGKQFPGLSPDRYPEKQQEKLKALKEAEALLMSTPALDPTKDKAAQLQADLDERRLQKGSDDFSKTLNQAARDGGGLPLTPPDSPIPTFSGPKTIKDIIEKHPLSEQSFFADVSDTKDILEAVEFYLHHDKPSFELLPPSPTTT